jgi:hypothetical protein
MAGANILSTMLDGYRVCACGWVNACVHDDLCHSNEPVFLRLLFSRSDGRDKHDTAIIVMGSSL